jgi:hypothetical protein
MLQPRCLPIELLKTESGRIRVSLPQLARKPLQVHAAAVDVGVRMPESRDGRTSPAERAVLRVRFELLRGGGEHRGRARHVHADPRPCGATGQKRGRRVTTTGDDRDAGHQSAPPRHAGSRLANHSMWSNDAWQFR